MSNRRKAGMEAGPGWLCRVGERAYVRANGVAPDVQDAWARIAVREMQFEAAGAEFTLLQMPASFAPDESGTALAVSLVDFLGIISTTMRGAFVKRLYGIARLFQLEADPVFCAATAELRQMASERRATISLEIVEGVRTAIATLPSRARVSEGDLLVATGEALAMGSVEHVSPVLMRDEPRQKLAAIDLSREPAGKEFLLVGDAGPIAVDARIERHPNIDAFHTARATGDTDMVALMALADGEAGAALDRLTRRKSAALPVHEPFHDFYFELVASVALENGLFLAGWFHDPDGLLESVLAIDPGLEDAAVDTCWVTFGGRGNYGNGERRIKRFAAFLPRREGTRLPLSAPPVRITLSTGESHMASAETGRQDLLGKRTRILDTIARNDAVSEQVSLVYGPALAPLQSAINARQSVREVRNFGTRSTRKVTFVIPLYRETGFISSQLMAFTVDAFVRENCEILYVLDDPLISGEVLSLLEGSAFVYPLDITLVLLAVNGGYALANNFGVSAASGETLVLMNSDVIPKASGWLEPGLRKLSDLPDFSVIGPKLLYADETLQHAGMYFYRMSNGNWQNFHYWKGYGAKFEPATRERIVPAVTGACMLIQKHPYEAVGGFTADYVVGDYEDSDLCLKLRERGGVPLYMPSVELYHFERQSMPKDEDDIDRGSTIYNRAIHTQRWNEAITAVMAEEKDVRHAG